VLSPETRRTLKLTESELAAPAAGATP